MENWKTIPGFPDYSASDLGRIRRDTPSRGYPQGGHILKPGVGTKGHHYVNLRRDKRAFSRYVHRTILETFVGPAPADKPCCAHRNGDPSDNRLSNLRWATYKENSQDSIRHGTSKRPGGTAHFRAKLTPELIQEAKRLHKEGQSFRAIGRQLGATHNTIANAIRERSYRNEERERDSGAHNRDSRELAAKRYDGG